MSTSYEAKDTLVRGVQLRAQEVSLRVDLEAGLAEDPSVAEVSGAATATCSVDIDVKENVKKIHKAEVHDRKTGQSVAQTAEASASGSVITISDVDADVPDLSAVTITVIYEVE